jgi:hypothetical protein
MGIPKLKTAQFFPGLVEHHTIHAEGVGYHAIDVTLAVNTANTGATLVTSPPNTDADAGNIGGPVVHSLGEPPSVVIPMLRNLGADPAGGALGVGGLAAGVQFIFCTADNSAVYLWAKAWTGTLRGVAARVIVIP